MCHEQTLRFSYFIRTGGFRFQMVGTTVLNFSFKLLWNLTIISSNRKPSQQSHVTLTSVYCPRVFIIYSIPLPKALDQLPWTTILYILRTTLAANIHCMTSIFSQEMGFLAHHKCESRATSQSHLDTGLLFLLQDTTQLMLNVVW